MVALLNTGIETRGLMNCFWEEFNFLSPRLAPFNYGFEVQISGLFFTGQIESRQNMPNGLGGCLLDCS